MRRIGAVLVAVIGASLSFGQEVITPSHLAQSAEIEQPTAVTNGYIVMFAPGTSKNARAQAALQAGAQLRNNYESIEAIAITAPNANALNGLKNRSDVIQIWPDSVHRGKAKPGTGGGGTTPGALLPLDTRQIVTAEVQRVGLPATGSDGTGVGIAVLDTGIDFAHPDLAAAPNTAASAFNAITNTGGACQDDSSHGTHVAGLIAAQNNDIGILGVAPGAKLYCVKVLNNVRAGTDSGVMAGLDWVLQNRTRVTPPIRVVNMSFGRPIAVGETIATSPLRPLVQALYNAGVVIVVAAGNTPTVENSQLIPAAFPEVLAVGATVSQTGIRACLLFGLDLQAPLADAAAGSTTDGQGVTISAPGEERTDIVLLGPTNCVGLEYGSMSTTMGTGGVTRKLITTTGLVEARGTSFAAALVSGVAARVIDKGVTNTPNNAAGVENVRSWIKSNASRTGIAPLDNPLAPALYPYNFDGVREGIAQAPK